MGVFTEEVKTSIIKNVIDRRFPEFNNVMVSLITSQVKEKPKVIRLVVGTSHLDAMSSFFDKKSLGSLIAELEEVYEIMEDR